MSTPQAVRAAIAALLCALLALLLAAGTRPPRPTMW